MFLPIACVVLFAGLALSIPPEASRGPSAADARAAADRHAQSLRYFQRRLIADRGDTSSDFGLDLAMLGLRGRDLQSQPIETAFTEAHDRVRTLVDTARRRQFLLELFNETEE